MAFYEQYLKEHSSQSGNHSAMYAYTAYTLQKLYVYCRIGRASNSGLLESLASDDDSGAKNGGVNVLVLMTSASTGYEICAFTIR